MSWQAAGSEYLAWHKGTVVDDADRRVKIEILGREGRAYRIGVTR
jgi:hypothetical protein